MAIFIGIYWIVGIILELIIVGRTAFGKFCDTYGVCAVLVMAMIVGFVVPILFVDSFVYAMYSELKKIKSERTRLTSGLLFFIF